MRVKALKAVHGCAGTYVQEGELYEVYRECKTVGNETYLIVRSECSGLMPLCSGEYEELVQAVEEEG